MKFEAESRQFAKILRSLEQFFLTVGQNNFGNKIPFLIGSKIEEIRGKNILLYPRKSNISVKTVKIC